jgi:hypothetical protein
LGVVLFWGFTVDDALVSVRVAWRVANGQGYRFNAQGSVVDAVTPLGWVFVLVPFAKISPATAFLAARILGAIAWVSAAVHFGCAQHDERRSLSAQALLFAAAPLAAWSSSGMETGIVVALCTMALGRSNGAALAAGIAAALRPELMTFCGILGLRQLTGATCNRLRALTVVTLTFGPFIGVAFTRSWIFGTVLPLAALAKPSDLVHGTRYALGALLLAGPLWTWIGPGWKSLAGHSRWIAGAVVAHFGAVALVGGDWMPLWRLVVPSMPAALWVASDLRAARHGFWPNFSTCLALAVSAIVGLFVGAPARHVAQARNELVQRVEPLLAGTRLVAGLDVGWLGMATTANVMDLAGITDPRIARLAGGHTTKRIPNSLFESLEPDGAVLLSAPGETLKWPWWETQFARGAENRMRFLEYWRTCRVRGSVPLRQTTQFYLIVRCDLAEPVQQI